MREELLVGMAVTLALAGCTRPSAPSSSAAPVVAPAVAAPVATARAVVDGGRPPLGPVFLILLENHNWSELAGNVAEAPYLNRVLLPQASYAEAYYNPRGLHPSEPNYIWLEAGDNLGIRNDAGPVVNRRATRAHLTALLDGAGVSWRAYAEGISGQECPLRSTGRYAARHVPFLYFDDVTDGADPRSARCREHLRPFSELEGDLAAGRVARYNFITPDLCDDMHDRCGNHGDRIRQGDRWLERVVPAILASRSWQEGGAIFITWDEGEHGVDGPIGLVVLSPHARGHGFHDRRRYDHSSTLRTLQAWLGVGPLLGAAATAPDLADLFSDGVLPALPAAPR